MVNQVDIDYYKTNSLVQIIIKNEIQKKYH